MVASILAYLFYLASISAVYWFGVFSAIGARLIRKIKKISGLMSFSQDRREAADEKTFSDQAIKQKNELDFETEMNDERRAANRHITRMLLLNKRKVLLPDQLKIIVQFSDGCWKLSTFDRNGWMYSEEESPSISEYISEQNLILVQECTGDKAVKEEQLKIQIKKLLFSRENLSSEGLALATMSIFKAF